jgi:hypothetical protein
MGTIAHPLDLIYTVRNNIVKICIIGISGLTVRKRRSISRDKRGV